MESGSKLLVILIGLTCVVQSSAQICPYIAEGCYCVGAIVQCLYLEALPQLQTGPNVTRVDTVYFNNGNITSLPKNSLPPGLVTISIKRLPLTDISNDVFDESANSLNYIELIGTKLTTLPSALLKLTNLTTLYIADTPIKTWNDSVLQHIGNHITELDLKNVGITGEPGWISNFHALEVLYLSQNNLKTISASFFNSFKGTLTDLTLKAAGLSEVPAGLSSLKNLAILDFSENNLNESEINKLLAIPALSNLSSLSLKSVGVINNLNFSGLENLTTIYLDGNNISDATVVSLPPSVTDLRLSRNNLSSVPTLVSVLTKLVSLDLSNNHITNITDTTFANLTLLDSLYLQDNPISTISPTAFASLKSLQTLYIQNTNLSEIPTALSDLSPVRRIYMDGIPSLTCPCNTSLVLHTWFMKKHGDLFLWGKCSTGQDVSDYLLNGCDSGEPTTTLPTPTTTTGPSPSSTTTGPPPSTTPKGHAPALELSLVCRYGFLLVFLSLLCRCVY
ncbi:hypothetical protein BsWGS_16489 [Bradybaena similaris]